MYCELVGFVFWQLVNRKPTTIATEKIFKGKQLHFRGDLSFSKLC